MDQGVATAIGFVEVASVHFSAASQNSDATLGQAQFRTKGIARRTVRAVKAAGRLQESPSVQGSLSGGKEIPCGLSPTTSNCVGIEVDEALNDPGTRMLTTLLFLSAVVRTSWDEFKGCCDMGLEVMLP